jgi:hypothetical protein
MIDDFSVHEVLDAFRTFFQQPASACKKQFALTIVAGVNS